MKSKFRFLTAILAASVLFNVRTEAQVIDYGRKNYVLSFEDGIESATSDKNSLLSTSDEHNKLGEYSLKWNWHKKGAYISLNEAIHYLPENPDPKETSVSSFVFWAYAPKPLEGSLKFVFLKKGKECCHFSYSLGFLGWRGAWVAFDRDMQGTPEIGMDEIRIYAPKGMKEGCLYFDGIIPASFQDVRHHTPDWQAPFINEKTTNHWLILNNSWKLKLDIPLKDNLEISEQNDLNTVKDRFIEIVTKDVKPYTLKQAQKVYDSYGISFNTDGSIKGKPIYFIRYGETFLNLGISDTKQALRKNGQLLRTLNDHLLRIAVSTQHTSDADQKAAFTKIYLNLTRHLLDQGFEAGSGLGTLHHLGYSMRNFYTAPVIMQDALREAGLDRKVQQAMEWFSGVGEIKIAPTELGMDIDAFNTSLMGRMASVIMLEDTPYKYAYMQALSRWIDNGMKHTEGLRPCFKRDGSVVHHRKSYPAYATGGFTGAVDAVWMLAKTGFAISEESHQNLKDALMAMRFYCYRTLFPLAMSGRHPDGEGALIRNHYFRLALAGSPDGKEEIDKELGGAYLDLPRQTKKKKEGHSCIKFYTLSPEEAFLQQNGITRSDIDNQTRTFGFNCSMSHRFGKRLVTIAGHSRYLWSAEIYNNANHYGRYLTHGSIQTACGFAQKGWDWCHIPGTTAAVLPMEKMKANVLNVDQHSGYEEMLLSDEWFAGGVTHKGICGSFGMKLHEHDKYNGSLRARKSFFTFENRVICLGSDIESSLEGAPVHTTLFQNHVEELPDIVLSPYVNERKDIIRNCLPEVYFIKGAQAHRTRGIQHSLHEETDQPTEGDFEKAYIEHGDIVKDGRYEYMIFMPVSLDDTKLIYDELALEEYYQALPYTVLRHDTSVHGVRDHASGTRAFAVFEEGEVDSLIISSTPAMLMYSIQEDEMTLSASNPDLALYEGPADEKYDADGNRIERSVYSREWINNPCGETTISLTLNGHWEITEYNGCKVGISRADGQTKLIFTSKEARTEEIKLRRTAL